MAWIIGGVTKEEAEELKRRGWDLLKPESVVPPFPKDTVAVFVDNDLFKIMSGPDWEGGSIDKIKKLNGAGLSVCFDVPGFITVTVRGTSIWWFGKTIDEVYAEAKNLGYIKE